MKPAIYYWLFVVYANCNSPVDCNHDDAEEPPEDDEDAARSWDHGGNIALC